MADFDRLLSLETKLIEQLNEIGVVDGHDFGLGEFGFSLVLTERAGHHVHAELTNSFSTEGIPNELRSAYREANGED